MLDAKGWLLYVLVPLLGVLIIDQMTKELATALTETIRLGFVEFQLIRNPGFMMGSLGSLSKLYTVVAPATIGALLLFVFVALQDFLPIQSPALRIGSSVFVGGVLGNIIDRVRTGDVVDFVILDTPLGSTGVFNVADALQWVGVAIAGAAFFANGRLLYPVEQRRGRKWIDPAFQLKYCAVMVGAGAGFALVGGALSYTFLKSTLAAVTSVDPAAAERIASTFISVYAGVAGTFFVMLAVIGVHLSHRIVGPIKGFEAFLDEMLRGSTRQFRLRKTDDFRQLEGMADRFYALFHERLGVSPISLQVGDTAPDFQAQTSDRGTLTAQDLAGKKVWMIFYRYATCPLCAVHVDSIKETIQSVQVAGVMVVAVYESSPEEFSRAGHEATVALLKSLNIPMIADPDRQLYRAFRTRSRVLSLIRPRILVTLLRAQARRFVQGRIEGKLGQLPAHFLIDEKSVIVRAFYGENAVDHLDLTEARRFAGLG